MIHAASGVCARGAGHRTTQPELKTFQLQEPESIRDIYIDRYKYHGILDFYLNRQTLLKDQSPAIKPPQDQYAECTHLFWKTSKSLTVEVKDLLVSDQLCE